MYPKVGASAIELEKLAKKNDLKIKCDIMGCKNLVNYSVSTSDNPRNNFHIYLSCF